LHGRHEKAWLDLARRLAVRAFLATPTTWYVVRFVTDGRNPHADRIRRSKNRFANASLITQTGATSPESFFRSRPRRMPTPNVES
jgi:hypothetical protein